MIFPTAATTGLFCCFAGLAITSICHGFMPQYPGAIIQTNGGNTQSMIADRSSRSTLPFPTVLFQSSANDPGGGGGDDRKAIMARNDARTCVKAFMTQRAIQSFMFLIAECRDPHSGKWIEDFLGLQNLSEFHGTGAFNISRFPTWETVLLDMMEQPQDYIIVSAKRRGRGHGGWSKNNPYLEERWVEFKIDIDPPGLAQRILSVRGQISDEFEEDLEIVISTNNQIMDSYFEKLKRSASNTNNNSDPQQQQWPQQSPQELASSFDRVTSNVLSSNMESSVAQSSPYRGGNFDLLYNLCTQASIHELLRELQDAGDHREVSFTWLRDFYTERVEDYFDGDQSYGRADDFIEAMLLTPPAVRDLGLNRQGKAVIGLIDPLGLAEQIIARRTAIATQWKSDMGQTASDHMQLQKALLEKRFKPMESSNENIKDEEPGDSAGRPSFD